MARSIQVKIIGDASQLSSALKQSAGEVSTFGSKLESAGQSMARFGARLGVAGAAVTGVAGLIGKKLVDAAISAQEQTGKLDVAMKNQGESLAALQPRIDAVEASNRKLGFTNEDTRASFIAFTNAGEKVTQATKDMTLAEDYARVKGISLADATMSIVKVHQGLLRPLKELGISLPSMTDHMKALTAAHKAAGTAITATEKALAYEQDKQETGTMAIGLMTQKLRGQADEFSKSAAGGMAQYHAQMGNIEEKMGGTLLPLFSRFLDLISSLMDKFDSLSPHTQKLISFGVVGAAALGVFMTAAGALIGVIGELTTALGFLAANPIVLLVAGLVAIGAAMAAAVLWPDKLREGLEKLGISAQTSARIVNDLRDTFEVLKRAGEALVSAVRDHWGQISATIQAAADAIRTIIQATVAVAQAIWRNFGSNIIAYARADWAMIKGVIGGALDIIRGVLDVFVGVVHGDWQRAWDGVKEIFSGTWQTIVSIFRGAVGELGAIAGAVGHVIYAGIIKPVGNLIVDIPVKLGSLVAQMVTIGIQIVAGLAQGIVQDADALVHGAVSYVTSLIPHWAKKLLGILSPSRVMADQVGRPVAEGIALGMIEGQRSVVTAAGALASATLSEATRLQNQLNQMARDQTDRQNAQGLKDAESALAIAEKKGKDVAKAEQKVADARLVIEQTMLQRKLDVDNVAYAKEQTAFQNAQTKLQALQQANINRMTAAAQAAASTLSTVWSRVSNKALQAFDAISQAYVPPAQQANNDISSRRQAEDMQNSITDAYNSMLDAQQTYQDAKAVSDASGLAADLHKTDEAHQSMLEAQLSYARAQEDVAIASNMALAAQQQTAWDEARANQRDHLQQMLDDTLVKLDTIKGAWSTSTSGILDMLNGYGVSFSSAGSALGKAFAASLTQALQSAISDAQSLAGASVNLANAKSGTASSGGGGSSTAFSAQAVKIHSLAGGGDIITTGLVNVHAGERVVPADVVRGRGGGGPVFNITLNGGATADDALLIRNELMRFLRANPSLYGARA